MSATADSVASGPFNRRTLSWGLFASLLAAAGFFLLSTYAPDFRLGGQGGASPLSKGGTGFAGLAKLLELTDDAPRMVRRPEELGRPDLLVVTIDLDASLDALEDIVERRAGLPTLFILPKWIARPLPGGPDGWEMRLTRLPAPAVENWLGQVTAAAEVGEGAAAPELRFFGRVLAAPAETQWLRPRAPGARPLISAGPDKAVLVQLEGNLFFVLADPDLLNNAGLKEEKAASAALAMIDHMRPNDEPVMFDLTLHGAGRQHDLAKLLVEPPFLALTLTILAAAALAVLHGLGRFGPPEPETRAIPFGKRALVDTTATLLSRAGRLDGLGPRYAALMRTRAAALLGAPPNLKGEALDRWLDSRDKDGGLGTHVAETAGATDRIRMVPAARRLHEWIAGRLRERR